MPKRYGQEIRQETWKKGLKITDLKEGDLIYVQKVINDFMYNYECKFLKFEKGLVYVQIEFYYPEWGEPEEQFIRVRKKSTYLWGRDTPNGYPHCHWCQKDGDFK